MDRKEFIYEHIEKSGPGIEVGPGPYPVAPKKEGFNTTVIDCVDTPELVKKFADIGGDVSGIEAVDLIWNGQPYCELTGNTGYYNWIIASHLIEHTPDLIGFLNDCSTILKPQGKLVLVVPDMRFCFDCRRMPTGISQIIDAHINKQNHHSAGKVAEFFLYHTNRGEHAAWHKEHYAELAFSYPVDNAVKRMQRVKRTGVNLDIHAWCFTPSSFRLLILELQLLRLTRFNEVSFRHTVDHEFICILSESDTPSSLSRETLLESVSDEIIEGLQHSKQTSAPEEKPKKFWKW